jgi:sialate O-acetylesterase
MSSRALLTFATFLAATAAGAAPVIDPQFGDHAVIQRGKLIPLSGTASPGERLTVKLDGDSRAVTADNTGRWTAEFPARTAVGGSHVIRVVGAGGASATTSDIAIGDVWLCSGQSNMELPVSRAFYGEDEVRSANDRELRLLKVDHQLAGLPRQEFEKRPSWQSAAPDAVRNFSAACYFMARDYRTSEKVPIGAIDSSWGGTPIRAWMSESAARAGGNAQLAELLDLHRRDSAMALRRFGDEWGAWWRSQTHDKPGQEPWVASDRLQWKPVPSIGYWDEWGPEWKNHLGNVWVRRRLTLTPAEAAQAATLSLGVIDDMDQTFVNGLTVGGTNDWAAHRNYPVPKGVLKPGENEILVFVRNTSGPGGFAGPANEVKLSFADGHEKPLGDAWQYSLIADAVGGPPTTVWDGPNGISTIYNAMVAPFGALGLKGVAWYQGEADVGEPGYDRRLAAWMSNWRTQFRDPRLPFLIVGLAGWGTPISAPKESGWAALTNEQRLAVSRDPRTALVSALDLGPWAELHPQDKQDVGHRLALAGRTLAYSGGTLGPMPIRAIRSGGAVIVSFSKPLQALSGGQPIGFQLCATTPDSCRFAHARVMGSTVEIASDGRAATRVRYAWADYSIVNLYDLDLLPAPVFELPVQ